VLCEHGALAVEQGLSPKRALRLRARTSKLLGSSIQEIDVISAAVNWLNDKSTPAALVPEVEGNETLPSCFMVPCSKMFSIIAAWAPCGTSPIEQTNPKIAPNKSLAVITHSLSQKQADENLFLAPFSPSHITIPRWMDPEHLGT
jgi:hypothetical protein